jgi:hypothetical protein
MSTVGFIPETTTLRTTINKHVPKSKNWFQYLIAPSGRHWTKDDGWQAGFGTYFTWHQIAERLSTISLIMKT